MTIITSVAIFIVWVGFVFFPTCIAIYFISCAIQSIKELKQIKREYKLEEIRGIILTILFSIFLIAISTIILLLPIA